MNITKLVTAVAIAGSALVMGACGSSSGGSSSPTTVSSDPSGYVTTLDGLGTDFSSMSGQDLLMLGNAVCSDFEAGDTLQQVLNDVENAAASPNNDTGLTSGDLGSLAGAAVKYLCPQYLNSARAQYNSDGYSNA